jgi:hypothetical protein
LNLTLGGDVVNDIVGIGAGHAYFYLKDIAPLTLGYDFLKTPFFLMRLIDKKNPVSSGPTARPVERRVRDPQFVPLTQLGRSASYREGTTENNQDEQSGNMFRSISNQEPTWD